MQQSLKRVLSAAVVGIAFGSGGSVPNAWAATAGTTETTSKASKSTKPAKASKTAKPAKATATAPKPSAATSTAEVEQLKAMVPTRIGRWKRVATPAPAAIPEDPSARGVQAEFAAGRQHIALEVSKAVNVAAEPSDLPRLTRNDAGHELVYREGRELVVERVRSTDGQAQVTLRRDDGLTVVAEGTGIAPERLKAVARAVGRRS
jgi:hypothetical protein